MSYSSGGGVLFKEQVCGQTDGQIERGVNQTSRGAGCIWDGKESKYEKVSCVMCYYRYWTCAGVFLEEKINDP